MNLQVRESTRKVVYLNVVDPFADSASELPCKREQFVQLQKQSKNFKRKKRNCIQSLSNLKATRI